MTSTQERPLLMIPASRRESPAVPVLIRVPNLAGAARGPVIRLQPRRRRRLRREVRVAATLLLLSSPFAAAASLFAVGGLPPASRDAAEVASDSIPELIAEAEDEAVAPLRVRLQPIVALSAPVRDAEVPVVVPGYLLPAEATEETSDGGR